MRCKEVKDLIVPFLEGELAPSAELMVSEHLAKCTRCVALGRQLDALEIPMPQGPTIAQTLQMHAALDDALNGDVFLHPPNAAPRTGRWYAPILPIAVGFMVLIGLSFWQPEPNQPQIEITQPTPAGVITPVKHWF